MISYLFSDMVDFYLLSVDETLKKLKSSLHGLTKEEASLRQKEYGLNEIIEAKKKSNIQMFLEQFKSILIIILIIAVIISFLLGEFLNAVVILIILVLNAVLGFYQEKKAEKALEALKKLAVPMVEVIRDGKHQIIKAKELTVGDILVLKAGDKVGADCRLIECMHLRVDESILTGESVPVDKSVEALSGKKDITEQKNMVFASTVVVHGHGKGVVTAVGTNTEFGKIARMLQVPEERTPLQEKLGELGMQLGILFVLISFFVFLLGIIAGMPLIQTMLAAIALAVAAVPEGLPASITIALSLGVHKMAKRNAIVRRLAAVETLGSTTVICTDKTGTLTANEMTVRKIYTDKVIEVTGQGFDLNGKFLFEGKEIKVDAHLFELLKAGALCNDATLETGDPTEIALLVSAKKAGVEVGNPKRIDEIAFTPERKLMSVLIDKVYTKGATEEVLIRSNRIFDKGIIRPINKADIERIIAVNDEFAAQGLRVLAFAFNDSKKLSEKDLVFLGLQAMMDPPRIEVFEALKKCTSAGIRVIMITGDHPTTALAIAKELHIATDGIVLTGQELDKMNDKEFEKIIERVNVFARVSPEHKVRITNALKKKGHVVAMTGDGINDAPALKRADIGIAMGITGSDVSKEASDMVLADDNFATIVNAVEEGRGIYDNIRKVIAYLLSGNFVEILVIASGIFGGFILGFGPLLPLIAIQILWINLVTDGLPALALSMDPGESDVMQRKPREKNESIWKGMRLWLLDYVVITTILTLALFVYGLQESLIKAQTMVFTSIMLFEKFQSFACRSLEKPVFWRKMMKNKLLIVAALLTFVMHLAILYVPILNKIFHVVPLSVFDWLLILILALSVFAYLELYKKLKTKEK